MSRRRVCLFGLSADPPTAAHVGMAGTLCQQGDFDEIRMMPVYQHQFSVSLTISENNHFYLFQWLSQEALRVCVVCCWPKVKDFALDDIYVSINSCTDSVP
jgi:nicotinic acid mononucleotide adenylyltransferase